MFLHIGEDFSISNKDIVGIFNIENLDYMSYNNSFLRESDEEGFVRRINKELPKSFVLCHVDGKPLIYLSPISSKTLIKRNNRLNNIKINKVTGGKNGRK